MPVQLLLCQLCKTQRPSANVVTSGRQTLGRLGVVSSLLLDSVLLCWPKASLSSHKQLWLRISKISRPASPELAALLGFSS